MIPAASVVLVGSAISTPPISSTTNPSAYVAPQPVNTSATVALVRAASVAALLFITTITRTYASELPTLLTVASLRITLVGTIPLYTHPPFSSRKYLPRSFANAVSPSSKTPTDSANSMSTLPTVNTFTAWSVSVKNARVPLTTDTATSATASPSAINLRFIFMKPPCIKISTFTF